MGLFVSVLFTLAAAPEPLLVAPYQSLGVDSGTVSAISEALRLASDRTRFAALPLAESERVGRSAVMCGEDGPCLATVGQRSNARWVLAFGVGRVGTSLLLTAIFVDVAAGKELMRGSRRISEGTPDWISVAKSLVDEVVKPPAEPLVVQVPIEVVKPQKTHKFRPGAFTSLGITIALGLITTGLGLTAWGNYAKLTMSNGATYPGLAATQRGLNASADIFLIGTAAAGAAALLFFILDWTEQPVMPVPE
jgi:hypothetical protein